MKIYSYKDFMVWTFILVLAVCMGIGFKLGGLHGSFKGAYLSLCISIPMMIAISFTNLFFMKTEERKVRADWELYQKEQQKRYEQKLSHWTMSSEKFFLQFMDYLTPYLVIDSSIWMHAEYSSFFVILEAACRRKNYTLELYVPQFDEISTYKNVSAISANGDRMADIAMDRIEHLQKKGFLSIKPFAHALTDEMSEYHVMNILLSDNINNGVECTFFSEDKEIRIRARQFLADCEATNWRIVDIEDILGDCRHCVDYVKQNHLNAVTQDSEELQG